MTTEKTLPELAGEAAEWFETAQRDGDSTPSRVDLAFTRCKENAPEWIHDMVRAAHDDANILPDDWRYSMIEELLSVMSGYSDLEDASHEIIDGCVDVYTSDLTAWLASHNTRAEYLNEAMQEFGKASSGSQLLQQAQYLEIQEIYYSLIASLTKQLETEED